MKRATHAAGSALTLATTGFLVVATVATAIRFGGAGRDPSVAESWAFCPINTGGLASAAGRGIALNSQPPFEQLWPGTSLQLPNTASYASGAPARTYTYKIALDGYVIAVANDNAMSFLWNGTNQGLTRGHLQQIFGSWGLYWDQLTPAIPGAPHRLIVPRSYVLDSTERRGLVKELAGLSLANEEAAIAQTGLPRVANAHFMVYNSLGVDHVGYYLLSTAEADPNFQNSNNTHAVPVSWTGGSGTFWDGDIGTVLYGNYPLIRDVYAGVRDKSLRPRIDGSGVDNSDAVLADDWVNYLRSPAGVAIIQAQGFVWTPPEPRPPIPDWDMNMDGSVNLLDLGAVASKWGASSSCKGWIRADGNNSGGVSLADIGIVTSKWATSGFQCAIPTAPLPCPE